MRRKMSWLASIAVVLLLMLVNPQRVSSATTAMIFCNGNMASVGGLTPTQINGYRASGLTTMVIFTMGVEPNGNFNYGGTICSNGVYIGPSNWGSLLNQCRTAPSSINRIEVCFGGWGNASWNNIKSVIAANGTNSNTVLYKNLVALKNALGIDAIDNDDEQAYDSASTIQFGKMCASVGLKLSLCPYTNPGYWQAVKAGLDTNTCDQVYLQCYDGGKYNDPGYWNSFFGGLKVIPGYWDNERDTTFLTKMQAWSTSGGNGGFLWPMDEGGNPPAGPGEMKQYTDWILNCYKPLVTPVTAADVVGGKISFVFSYGGADNLSCQWQVIRNGVTNNIPGATNTVLTLSNLQLTNTAKYQVFASNALGVVTSSLASLTVSSVPTPVNNIITSCAAQTGMGYGFPFTPSWTLVPGSVIYGQSPISTNGNFNMEAFGAGRNVNSLTSGDTLTISQPSGITSTNYVTGGNGAGTSVIYTLTNSSPGGYNLTNITVYGGWFNSDRDQQAYTIYYSKITAPSTFIYLGTVNYNPVNVVTTLPSLTRVTLTPGSGALATNVAAVKFDFSSPTSEYGYCGYAEIGLYGVPLSPVVATNTLPATAGDVVGSQVSFTAAFSSINPLNYQWRAIKGGITNNIPGATNLMLTLAKLQLTDSASYQVQASNAYGVVVSAPGSLTVSSVPAAVNNVVTSMAAQTGFGNATTFAPTWTIATNNSLIAGQSPSSTSGNFTMEVPGRNINSLTDGGDGALAIIPATSGFTSTTNYVTCGSGYGSCSSVVYTLGGATSGYNLTNIMVYGGWADAGRDQQAYTVRYSTVAAPSSFIALATVNFNPANAANVQSATRATLTPASGVLASNVAALKFDFATPTSENGYCGYSEISVYGAPTLQTPVVSTAPANISAQFGGSALTLSWPADHTGWRLQVQTNEPTTGLSTNWTDVSAAATTNQMVLPITPGNGSVFYRMVYP